MSTNSSGKGDGRRPRLISEEEYSKNYDAIFGKKKEQNESVVSIVPESGHISDADTHQTCIGQGQTTPPTEETYMEVHILPYDTLDEK